MPYPWYTGRGITRYAIKLIAADISFLKRDHMKLPRERDFANISNR